MAPLPENSTDRYWLKYSWGKVEHELLFRLGDAASPADGIDVATDFANSLKPFIGTEDQFSGLRYSLAGTNISIPLSFTPIAGTGDNAGNDVGRSGFVALSGRSAGGRRCRVTFFGNGALAGNDFRSGTGGTGLQGTFYNAVTTSEPPLVAVDGSEVTWNGYVNQGLNAYWQRQFR